MMDFDFDLRLRLRLRLLRFASSVFIVSECYVIASDLILDDAILI
jgi:hypothetical protein